ncbi:MAG TPA: FtsX-like permease family protein [Streptosporangiaceae bacterium]|nr:FtsX-like permease family protein [Streptosporangiaceae bacterium]
MSRFVLIGRLAAGDLRHRPAQALLLLLPIIAATTVLSLALALHGVTSQPYQHTRAVTRGPDVVASLGGPVGMGHRPGHAPQDFGVPPARQIQAEARSLISAPGVTSHSGPYPVASVVLRLGTAAVPVEAEGRDEANAALDQPVVTAGSWVRPDGIVLERTFAEAIDARVGDRVTVDGRPYTVVGIAVTAASAPYPNMCFPPGGNCNFDLPVSSALSTANTGLAWTTVLDARSLASAAAPLTYLLDLKLKYAAKAQRFVSAYNTAHRLTGSGQVVSWQSIAYDDALLVQDEQQVLTPGAWLLGLLAVASVAVLAGGRMSEQASRIGLLKAVGGTPGLVALVLLAENVLLAIVAAAVGLLTGWLTAPLITSPGGALVGAPGAPSITAPDAGLVAAVALIAALASTLVPAIRASRVAAVTALAERVRPPRRRAALIRVSRRLPVPLLLGVRVIARRPRRAALTAASIAITVTGLVAVLAFHAKADELLRGASAAVSNPVIDRDEQMLLVVTVALVALAALTAIVTTWATVLETRRSSAVARALGASPRQVSAGLAIAQAIPALPGALLGVPLGLGVFAVANSGGAAANILPPAWWLAAAVIGTVLAVLVLTAIPARFGARQPIVAELTGA